MKLISVDMLFAILRNDYDKYDNRLKRSVLKVFITIYDIFHTNGLFSLDQEFHSKTLQMVFMAFEPQNGCSDDSNVLLNSMELLKRLSTIESVLNVLIADENVSKYLHILLTNESEEMKICVFVWICDLLENDSIRRKFANILLNDSMNSLIELLNSSHNPFISK